MAEELLHNVTNMTRVTLTVSYHILLQDFAQQAENIFRGSDRRNDLDKAYGKLISAIFEQIGRLAADSQKTPSDVVLFGRCHHLCFVSY